MDECQSSQAHRVSPGWRVCRISGCLAGSTQLITTSTRWRSGFRGGLKQASRGAPAAPGHQSCLIYLKFSCGQCRFHSSLEQQARRLPCLHSRHAEAERRSSSELKDHDRIVNMQLADGLHDLLMLQLTLVPILIQVWCIQSYASKKPPAYSTYTAGPDEESPSGKHLWDDLQDILSIPEETAESIEDCIRSAQDYRQLKQHSEPLAVRSFERLQQLLPPVIDDKHQYSAQTGAEATRGPRQIFQPTQAKDCTSCSAYPEGESCLGR